MVRDESIFLEISWLQIHARKISSETILIKILVCCYHAYLT